MLFRVLHKIWVIIVIETLKIFKNLVFFIIATYK